MAVALLVWVAWIINSKYEVRSRRYEKCLRRLSQNTVPFGYAGRDFFCLNKNDRLLLKGIDKFPEGQLQVIAGI